MKRVLSILLITMMALTCIGAEDTSDISIPNYSMGSQIFTFRFGPEVPTFMYRPSLSPTWLTFSDTHFKVGGYGSLSYQGFLSSHLAIGGELGYLFDYDQSELFTSVPLLAKLTYIPFQGTFELPLSISMGFAYNSYDESSYLSLFTSAEVGLSYFFTESWGFTLSGGLQVIPEIYFDDKADQTTYTGFMPITLAISYRTN
ncbi:MAG: hypothetical protein PQJ47_10665 [Sphaerochaetaceae bacterium]|nr:hypothetical protein [Sphaerochaetaceae bacterium]